MAKESGLGWTTYQVDDSSGALQDLRTDTTSLSFATPRAVQDITGLDKSAMERLLLLADMTQTPAGVFDDGANLAHVVFKTVPSTSVNRESVITISGQTIGSSPVLTFVVTDFPYTRAQSGEFTWTAPMSLANGALPTWS
jgi:hypothetical protein